MPQEKNQEEEERRDLLWNTLLVCLLSIMLVFSDTAIPQRLRFTLPTYEPYVEIFEGQLGRRDRFCCVCVALFVGFVCTFCLSDDQGLETTQGGVLGLSTTSDKVLTAQKTR